MKPKSKLILRFAGMGLVTTLAVASTVIAGTLPKEGRYDFTACWSGVATPINFSKTAHAFSYEFTGENRSNPPGGLFDKSSFHCIGMNAVLNGKRVSNAVCEALDRDGDKRLTYFALGTDGKYHPENIAGTGKYDGFVMNGTVKPLGPFPAIKPGTFQNCNHQTGTYKLK